MLIAEEIHHEASKLSDRPRLFQPPDNHEEPGEEEQDLVVDLPQNFLRILPSHDQHDTGGNERCQRRDERQMQGMLYPAMNDQESDRAAKGGKTLAVEPVIHGWVQHT